jgi:uncharacterized damage-inducible protein DinB
MQVENIDSFLSYFESIRGRTLRVVRAMPPDMLELRHSPGVFSFGDLARHIVAVERFVFCETVFGRPSRYRSCGPELADGLDKVIGYMEKMHAEAVALLREMTPEQLAGNGISPIGKSVPVNALLRAMVEHEAHHRGEMYVYLALAGVARPPLYGVTEEELRRHSAA